MSFKNVMFGGVTRYTLLLGNNAAVLMLSNADAIETSWILPYSCTNFYETLLGALKRHPFYPLKIVVDSALMDVRLEALPPVSPWARTSIINRQRAHFFKDALLETSDSFVDKMTGKWSALHVASPNEIHIKAVFDKIYGILNPIEPISFFASEWFDYAGQVSVMPKKGWAFINVLCESFGLRQMIFKDGKILFTRNHTDCVPSLTKDELAKRIAEHIRTTQDYLPRIDAELARAALPRLYVADFLQNLSDDESLKALKTQVIAIAAPKTEFVPHEWSADLAWLYVAAREKNPAMPIDTQWLRERRSGGMKKQIALWVLIVFGSAGIFSGMSILTQIDEQPAMQQSQPAPSLSMEPIKPVSVIEPPLATPPALKLNAVIYNNPQDWVVWINGVKHVPGAPLHNLTMVSVSPQHVMVNWQEGKAEQQISLNLVPSLPLNP